jgi:hypothetical protein
LCAARAGYQAARAVRTPRKGFFAGAVCERIGVAVCFAALRLVLDPSSTACRFDPAGWGGEKVASVSSIRLTARAAKGSKLSTIEMIRLTAPAARLVAVVSGRLMPWSCSRESRYSWSEPTVSCAPALIPSTDSRNSSIRIRSSSSAAVFANQSTYAENPLTMASAADSSSLIGGGLREPVDIRGEPADHGICCRLELRETLFRRTAVATGRRRSR